MNSTTMLWKRLDVPGHDACRLEPPEGGWQLDGTAVFSHEGAAARLDYHVTCDQAWRSQRGAIRGWIGPRAISIEIARTTTPRGGLPTGPRDRILQSNRPVERCQRMTGSGLTIRTAARTEGTAGTFKCRTITSSAT